MDQRHMRQHLLHLIALQMPYEVPLDIAWEVCGLGHQLLHPILAEYPLPRIVGLPYGLRRPGLRHRNQRNARRDCRPQAREVLLD